MGMLRRGVMCIASGCLACQFAASGWAQGYPIKTVRLLVSFSAGSGSDTIGRIIAGGLTQVFGQQVIVDNRAGAAGNIGAEIAAKAPPDGYTVFLVNMGHAANVTLYSNLPYDLMRDFAPVTQVASSPSIAVVHPSLPVKSITELVKLAKARPGAINYSSGGVGTPTFVAGELFKAQAGVDMLHVPYRSGGEAITAVVTGEVSVYFAPLSTALPHVRQGRLRALAVTTARRLSLLPEYPTSKTKFRKPYCRFNDHCCVYGISISGSSARKLRVTPGLIGTNIGSCSVGGGSCGYGFWNVAVGPTLPPPVVTATRTA